MKYEPNGDFYIYADSKENINRVTDVEVNIEVDRCRYVSISISYLINGSFKKEKDGYTHNSHLLTMWYLHKSLANIKTNTH